MLSKRPRLRRVLRVIALLVAIWLIFDLMLAATIYFYGAIDRTQPADVIVVLGAGLRRDGRADLALTRRSRHAADLWHEGVAPLIICAGGYSEYAQRIEAEACRDVLLEEGVPYSAIVLESGSRSTEENALNTQRLMAENGWQTAALVTDGFHMMRASWIFADAGVTVYNSPTSSTRVFFGSLLIYTAREVIAVQWQFIKEVLNLPNTYVQGI